MTFLLRMKRVLDPEAAPAGGIPLLRLHLLAHVIQLVLHNVHKHLDFIT